MGNASPILLLPSTLLGCVRIQKWESHQTNRRLNKGGQTIAWKSVIRIEIVLKSFGSFMNSSFTARLLLLCQILRKEKFANDFSKCSQGECADLLVLVVQNPRKFNLKKCASLRKDIEKSTQLRTPKSKKQDRCYLALFTTK